MKLSSVMEEGKEYCSANWNDTAAIFYTRKGNEVIFQNLYRYGKTPPKKIVSCYEWDKFASECDVNHYGDPII